MSPSIVKILEDSSNIFERVDKSKFEPLETKENVALSKSRVDRWRKAVANDDSELFKRRLLLDGLSLESVNNSLGRVCLVTDKNIPTWTETLEDLISSFELSNPPRREGYFINTPFIEIYSVFIDTARKKLGKEVISIHDVLSESAVRDLEGFLLNRLSLVCSGVLTLELNIARLSNSLRGSSSSQRYADFITQIGRKDSIEKFFVRYSVAARLIAMLIDMWVSATSEFIKRLNDDSTYIKDMMCKQSMGKVTNIEDGLSDPHNYGRTTKVITFDSGYKILYKPKSLGIDESYNRILEWFNERNPTLQFRVTRIIDKGNYGWVEFVENRPCTNLDQIKRFYRRSGMNLFLLYLLGSTDIHFENIIADGEYPVLVDFETIIPPYTISSSNNADDLAKRILTYSVLNTGLLPRWEFDRDKIVGYDSSGLGGGENGKLLPFKIPKLINLRSDFMQLIFERGISKGGRNRPIINGSIQSAENYVNEIESGFLDMHKFVSENKDQLLNVDSPFLNIRGLNIRFVNRNTRFYYDILYKSLHPNYLVDGVERSLEIDIVARTAMLNGQEHLWPIVVKEKEDLERMDIPIILTNSDSKKIDQGESDLFIESAYDRVLSRINCVENLDVEYQIGLIRGAFYSLRPHFTSSVYTSKEENSKNNELLDKNRLLEQVSNIADVIHSSAIISDNGDATWVGFEYIPEIERCQIQPIGYDLHSGRCGIALFLAASSKVRNSNLDKELALACIKKLVDLLKSSKGRKEVELIGVNGLSGIGSIAYSLAQLSDLLDEDDLIEYAITTARLVSSDLISKDNLFDFMSGSAGTILCLLSLYEKSGNKLVLEKAVECGIHLLNNEIKLDNYSVWRSKNFNTALTGMSHGSAGIGYSLIKLGYVTNDTKFVESGIRAFNYERSVFDKEVGNWPDFRDRDNIKQGEDKYSFSWCHGAPGIGFSRLAVVGLVKDDYIKLEIETVLKSIGRFESHNVDQLCCGNFGIIDLLNFASDKLSKKELRGAAIYLASRAVYRAKQKGYHPLFGLLPNVQNPSLFQGISGIGYGLVRLLDNSIPSVLVLE